MSGLLNKVFRDYLEVQSVDPDYPNLLEEWYGSDPETGKPNGTLDDLKYESYADYAAAAMFEVLETKLLELKESGMTDIEGFLTYLCHSTDLDQDIEMFCRQVFEEGRKVLNP